MTGDRFDAGQADVADLPELLPLLQFGDMNFHRGNANGFDGVQKGNAGMGVCAGVDDDAVCIPIGLLDLVYQIAFMIGL